MSELLLSLTARSLLRVTDANRLNKLINKAINVVGMELDFLRLVPERLASHRSMFSKTVRLSKCTTE